MVEVRVTDDDQGGSDEDALNISQVTARATGDGKIILPRRLRLVVIAGPDQGKEIELGRGTYVVGKGTRCQFQLTDPQVSRRHLEVQVADDGAIVRDLGSKNGSYFQAARFNELQLGLGSVVRIGASELKLASPASASAFPPSRATRFGRLIGRSLAMRELFAILERVALSNVPVLLGGETGTGKELCAEALHQASRIAQGPFIVCDIAGLPRTLIESELFGHVRGAFTGADRDREGAFLRANKGTIFIDEIGELELGIQPRLLRVLEQRQVQPVGASGYRPVDIRIIAATNRDLRAECQAGRFREDLYHRLSVVQVTLPPLRERKEDIPMLVESWLQPRGITASSETLGLLAEQELPGNVRELKNLIERGVSLLGESKILEPAFLGLPERRGDGAPPPVSVQGGYRRAKDKLVANWERSFVVELLSRCDGNISAAAREGGIDRAYLHRLMRKYGIKGDSSSE